MGQFFIWKNTKPVGWGGGGGSRDVWKITTLFRIFLWNLPLHQLVCPDWDKIEGEIIIFHKVLGWDLVLDSWHSLQLTLSLQNRYAGGILAAMISPIPPREFWSCVEMFKSEVGKYFSMVELVAWFFLWRWECVSCCEKQNRSDWENSLSHQVVFPSARN